MKTTREIYTCDFCGTEHESEKDFDACMLSHDIVYVGLRRQEWKSLLLSIVHAVQVGVDFDQDTVTKLMKYNFGVK